MGLLVFIFLIMGIIFFVKNTDDAWLTVLKVILWIFVGCLGLLIFGIFMHL